MQDVLKELQEVDAELAKLSHGIDLLRRQLDSIMQYLKNGKSSVEKSIITAGSSDIKENIKTVTSPKRPSYGSLYKVNSFGNESMATSDVRSSATLHGVQETWTVGNTGAGGIQNGALSMQTGAYPTGYPPFDKVQPARQSEYSIHARP